jgi:hypothetical protein
MGFVNVDDRLGEEGWRGEWVWKTLVDCMRPYAGEIFVWEFCEGKERR